MQVLLQLITMALAIAIPHFVIRHDERHLERDAWLRGWNDATHWSAIVSFSFLVLPVHFYRTRRSLLGLGQGLLWFLVSMVATGVVVSLLQHWLLGSSEGFTKLDSLELWILLSVLRPA